MMIKRLAYKRQQARCDTTRQANHMSRPTVEKSILHLVLAAYQAWGHVKPLCNLAARIVKSRPVTVTLVTARPFHERVDQELARSFEENENHFRRRIRVVAIMTNEQNPFDVQGFNASFSELYKKLADEEAVVCAKTGETLEQLNSPDAAILGIFGHALLLAVHEHSKRPVKVFTWYPGSVAAALFMFGPAGPNKGGDLSKEIEEETARSGKSIVEAAEEYFFGKHGIKGEIIRIPGLPPMYDYEFYPQDMIIKDPLVGMLHLGAFKQINTCDGIIFATTDSFEPKESIDAFRNWFAETSRKCYAVGPAVPQGGNAIEKEKKQSPQAAEIEEFLKSILQSHGEQSLVYISFGSMFWTVEPEKVWAFLDVLMEKNIPFIMSHASPFAKIPDSVSAKVKASGLGILSPWSPQQLVLAHPATGWFVTHCGFGGMMEAVSAGVPMICWPFQADQPLNAVHLTDNLNVAYELLEVRTGHGLQPLLRTKQLPVGTADTVREEAVRVLDQAFGSDGQMKRANILKLQQTISEAWTEEGPSQVALDEFLDSL